MVSKTRSVTMLKCYEYLVLPVSGIVHFLPLLENCMERFLLIDMIKLLTQVFFATPKPVF